MNRAQQNGWAQVRAEALAALDRFTSVALSVLALGLSYALLALVAGSALMSGAERCEQQALAMCVELSNNAAQTVQALRHLRDALPSEAVHALQWQHDLDQHFFIPFYAFAYALFAYWAGRAGASWGLSAALLVAVAVLVGADRHENAHMQQLIGQLRACTVGWIADHPCVLKPDPMPALFEAARWKWTAFATVSAGVAWACARAVRRRGRRLWWPAVLGLAATAATLVGAWWPEASLGRRVDAIGLGFVLGFATLIALGGVLLLRGARTVRRMRRQ